MRPRLGAGVRKFVLTMSRMPGQSMTLLSLRPVMPAKFLLLNNPNYGYASRRWLVSEMDGLPGLKA
jgi:hypothetical protein